MAIKGQKYKLIRKRLNVVEGLTTGRLMKTLGGIKPPTDVEYRELVDFGLISFP